MSRVVSDGQKVFGFLPVSYQIDIRTVRFLEKFMISFLNVRQRRPLSVRLEVCR